MMIIYQASLKPYCSINGTFNIKIQTCCTKDIKKYKIKLPMAGANSKMCPSTKYKSM